jgi:hypothetical protein
LEEDDEDEESEKDEGDEEVAATESEDPYCISDEGVRG